MRIMNAPGQTSSVAATDSGGRPVAAVSRPARLGLLAALALTVVLGGLALWRRSGHDALASARRKGVIRVGYAVGAPYAFLTPNGKISGEAPEIAQVIAKRLGIPRIEWRLTEFGSLIEGLEAGRFDVIAAGMRITPDRSERVCFSRPTFQVGPALLVSKGNPLGLHSFHDLVQHTNVRVAVLAGSTEESLVRRLGCRNECVVVVPDALSGLAAVQRGQADALARPAPVVRWMARPPNTNLVEAAEPFEAAADGPNSARSLGGFAFRTNDRALCRAWNEALQAYIGSEEHRRLVSAFGFSAAELPPGVTNWLNRASP